MKAACRVTTLPFLITCLLSLAALAIETENPSQRPAKPGTVRVAGIDCPALTQPFGPEAKAFVATLLNKRTVIVRPRGHDRHRRVWGDVLLSDGRSLGIEMLRAGWAQASATAVDERLSEFEQDARRAKIGLWKEPARVPVENVGPSTRKKSSTTDKSSSR